MERSARSALAGRAAALEPQQALDLAQLGVDPLQARGHLHEHVGPEVVADRHLVGEAAEVPLELGQLVRQLVAPPHEVGGDDRRAASWGGAPAPGDGSHRRRKSARSAAAGCRAVRPAPAGRAPAAGCFGNIRSSRLIRSSPRRRCRRPASCCPWAAPCRAAWSRRAASSTSSGTPRARSSSGPRACSCRPSPSWPRRRQRSSRPATTRASGNFFFELSERLARLLARLEDAGVDDVVAGVEARVVVGVERAHVGRALALRRQSWRR